MWSSTATTHHNPAVTVTLVVTGRNVLTQSMVQYVLAPTKPPSERLPKRCEDLQDKDLPYKAALPAHDSEMDFLSCEAQSRWQEPSSTLPATQLQNNDAAFSFSFSPTKLPPQWRGPTAQAPPKPPPQDASLTTQSYQKQPDSG